MESRKDLGMVKDSEGKPASSMGTPKHKAWETSRKK